MIQWGALIFLVVLWTTILVNVVLSLPVSRNTKLNISLGTVDVILGIIYLVIWWKYFRVSETSIFSSSFTHATFLIIFIGIVNIVSYFKNR